MCFIEDATSLRLPRLSQRASAAWTLPVISVISFR
jgi:hypothetical protein